FTPVAVSGESPNARPLASGRLGDGIAQPSPGVEIPGHGGAGVANSGSIIDALLPQLHDVAGAGERRRERREALKRRAEYLRLRPRVWRGAELLLASQLEKLLELLRNDLDRLLELLELCGNDLKQLLKLLLLNLREQLKLLNLQCNNLQRRDRR